jgi:cytochrome P450
MRFQALSWSPVVFASAIAAVIYFVTKAVQHRRSYKNLPKPPHHFLWGHLGIFGETWNLFPKGPHIQVATTTLSEKYRLPGLWYLDLWPLGPCLLVITDPELALLVTGRKNHPKHPAISQFMDPVLGAGNIVTGNGPVWKAAHNMLAPAFAPSHVRDMTSMLAKDVMVFHSVLQKYAASGKKFCLENELRNLIFDITGTAVFETSPGAQKEKSTLLNYFTEATESNYVVQGTRNPFIWIPARREMQAAVRAMDRILKDLIRERFKKLQHDESNLSNKRGLCIMDLMLREHMDEARRAGKLSLDTPFVNMATTHVKTLLLAASGTTASTLSFTYMFLSIYPDVVLKLRAEHDTIFAPGIEASYMMLQQQPQKLNELKYTTNVIKEVLRFYPIGHTARAEDSTGFITYQGKQYPTKGQLITPVQLAMHMNHDLFPNPMLFDPDRFARHESPRNAWRPFESGPRVCLGQTLAMDTMKATLLLTIRDFDFTCADLMPTKQRVPWTNLDTIFGDRAFQEQVFEAKPRDGMPMTVKEASYHTNGGKP